MSILTGHFVTQLPAPPTWVALTAYGSGSTAQPSPANGYAYQATGGGGTSAAGQPVWPTVLGATVHDGTVVWVCLGPILAVLLRLWDQEQCQAINGDSGGTWSPTTPITFLTGGGGVVLVQGPTQVTNAAELLVGTGAQVSLGANDFPRNGPTHLGLQRRILTSCELGVSDSPLGIRPDFALSGLDAVACALTYYVASADDSTVSATTVPVQWWLPLDVHNGATFSDVVLTYRANLGTPKARVVATTGSGLFIPAGIVLPMTSQALGADANGFVLPPAVIATQAVQSWTIPIDGGVASPVVTRDQCSYFLHVVEDQTQTQYPGTLPVYSPVLLATTQPIDMANAPATIDGVTGIAVGARILIKNQFNPDENGLYTYPGAGLPFPVQSASPVPYWVGGVAYALGTLIQPAGPVTGHGLFFKATAVAGTGTSGAHQPNWPLVTGAAIIDNAGANQITWTCQGPLDPYIYSPAVEMRTYGLLQGAAMQVLAGTVNGGTAWQYTGATISPTNLGSTPALGWVSIPSGFLGATTNDVLQEGVGVFAAQGNVYHAAACDFANITTQQFQ